MPGPYTDNHFPAVCREHCFVLADGTRRSARKTRLGRPTFLTKIIDNAHIFKTLSTTNHFRAVGALAYYFRAATTIAMIIDSHVDEAVWAYDSIARTRGTKYIVP